jgi:hypothetical protein
VENNDITIISLDTLETLDTLEMLIATHQITALYDC